MAINASGLFSATAFKGQVIGVSGAGHGIGQALATLLGELGASVLLMDIHAERLKRVEKELAGQGFDVLGVVTDVGRQEDLVQAVDALKARWGVLHGWVNNAAVNAAKTIEEQTEEEFRYDWEVNTLSIWRSLKLTLPLFPEKGGAIVNVSSIMASRSRACNMSYGSSKSAVEGLTRAMAVELASRRIRVNCVIPGSVHVQDTVEQFEERWGKENVPELLRVQAQLFSLTRDLGQPWQTTTGPGDVASMMAFLLSNASPYVTGTSIFVDGGLHAELRFPMDITDQQFEEVIQPAMTLRRQRDALRDQARAAGAINPDTGRPY